MTEDEIVGWHHRLDGHEFGSSSRSWCWAWNPGLLQSMGSQRVGHDTVTELNLFNTFKSIGLCNHVLDISQNLFKVAEIQKTV